MNRDEILSDLLTGELDEASEEAIEAFRRDPELEAEWREMRSIEEMLAAGAEFEREVVEESTASSSDTDVARVMALLRGDDIDPASNGASRGGAWWKAAAALALTAALSWWVMHEPAPSPLPDVLGDEIVLRDVSANGGYASFTWTDVGGAGRYFHIFVYSGQDAALVDEEPDLKDTTWTPDAARTADWPDEIVMIVRAYDITRSPLHQSQELSLSR